MSQNQLVSVSVLIDINGCMDGWMQGQMDWLTNGEHDNE